MPKKKETIFGSCQTCVSNAKLAKVRMEQGNHEKAIKLIDSFVAAAKKMTGKGKKAETESRGNGESGKGT